MAREIEVFLSLNSAVIYLFFIPRRDSATPKKYTICAIPNNGAITIIRQRPPLKNACGPSCFSVFLKKRNLLIFSSRGVMRACISYPMQSKMPLNCISPSAFFNACNRVLITSNGFTDNAANEPAAQPDANDTKKAASPLPSFFRGPN